MTRTPWAYERKSVPSASYRRASRAEKAEEDARERARQHRDVMARIERDGLKAEDVTVIDQDWHMSGASSRAKRPGLDRLLTALERDQVSVIYVRDGDRIFREAEYGARFNKLIRDRHVVVKQTEGPDIDTSTPDGMRNANNAVVNGQYIHDQAVLRGKRGVAHAKADGLKVGRPPYGWTWELDDKGNNTRRYVRNPDEDIDVIVQAYLTTGSFERATKLLNLKGVPTREGGPWRQQVVLRIIARERPDLLPEKRQRGVRGRQSHILARLLVCACGARMNGLFDPPRKDGSRRASYVCPNRLNHKQDADGKYVVPITVPESAILPVVQRMVDDAAVKYQDQPVIDPKVIAKAQADRAALDQLRPVLGDAAYAAAIAKVEASVSRDGTWRIGQLPLHWDADRASINAALRARVMAVRLDPDMRGVSVEFQHYWMVG